MLEDVAAGEAESEEVSEPEKPGLVGCALMLTVVIFVVIVMMSIRAGIDKRENWIKDLQRRVAELEQK